MQGLAHLSCAISTDAHPLAHADAFCIAFLILVSTRADSEFALTIAALPCALIILFLSAFAVRKEIYSLMCLCIAVMAAGMGYFVWKLTRIFSPGTEEEYRTVRLTLTFFSVFSIVSLAATIVLAIWCTVNFGKGLKEAHESMGGIVDTLDAKIRRGGGRSEASKPFGIDYDETREDDDGYAAATAGNGAEMQRLGVGSQSSSPDNYSTGHHGVAAKQRLALDEEDEDEEDAHYSRYDTHRAAANSGRRYDTTQRVTSPPAGPQRRVSLD